MHAEASIERLRMGMGGACARQDNTQELRSVIEISIKEVISGVIAAVLWFVFVCERGQTVSETEMTECEKKANILGSLSFIMVE